MIEGTETGEAFKTLLHQLDSARQTINISVNPEDSIDRQLDNLPLGAIAHLMVSNGLIPSGQNAESVIDQLNFGDPGSKKELINILDTAKKTLAELKDDVALNLDFQLGKEVAVRRNGRDGNPDYLERGWVVKGILANGLLEVASPDGEYLKTYSPNDLQKIQAAYNGASLKAEARTPEGS